MGIVLGGLIMGFASAFHRNMLFLLGMAVFLVSGVLFVVQIGASP
jgi:hypothetical protein